MSLVSKLVAIADDIASKPHPDVNSFNNTFAVLIDTRCSTYAYTVSRPLCSGGSHHAEFNLLNIIQYKIPKIKGENRSKFMMFVFRKKRRW